MYIKLVLTFLLHDIVSCLPPIVIVPGIGGSQIQARLNRSTSSHSWCYKKTSNWFTLWLNIEELLPLAEACWVENIKLVYDEKLDKMTHPEGVHTRIPDFGNTTGIEWLDPSLHGPGIYFYPFVDAVCRILGYKRGKSLRAAPYDFRFDPSYAGEYFEQLKKTIEDTYYDNNNKKIILTSHSMGAPYTLYFLQRQTQEWKDKFLEAWVTISGAFAGTVKSVLTYISGVPFGIPSILDKPRTLREFQRTFPSLPFILPSKILWKDNEVLVKTSNRTYTINDMDDLFEDIGFPLAKKLYKATPQAWSDEPPNVKIYCFHGTGMPSVGSLNYRKGYFPDYQPDIVHDDGDGTVNIRSLQACLRWQNSQNQKIHHEEFPGSEHNEILGDVRLIKTVIKVLQAAEN